MSRCENIGAKWDNNCYSLLQRPRGLGFLGRQAGKEQGIQPRPSPHTSVGERMKMCVRMKAFDKASQKH